MKDRFVCPFGDAKYCVLTQAGIRLGLIPRDVSTGEKEDVVASMQQKNSAKKRQLHEQYGGSKLGQS
jgi:hypothetical protein